jgi:pre-rRNA-processing protein IPI3
MRWDIAKHRVMNEIVNLAQPVTNIQMLKPDGLHAQQPAGCTIANIVKPNLEFSAQTQNGTTGVPAKYNLQAVITGHYGDSVYSDVHSALTTSGFPESMVGDALRALAVGAGGTIAASGNDIDVLKNERLADEVATLKRQLDALHDVEARRRTRRMARMEKREELGLKKREAYFEAKKKGKDGDVAMKKWEEREAMLDMESDDEYLGDSMELG